MTRLRTTATGLPQVLQLQISGRRRVIAAVVGVIAEVVAVVLFAQAETASAWVGVGGAVGALIAVFVAIVGGTLAGLVVAGAGSVLFVVAVAYAQPPDPVLGGVLIIAVWCAAAVIAGVMTSVLRERANTAYREVEEARNTAVRVSTALQRGFLPDRLPPISGVEIAAYFRPAGDAAEIGGDFYDVWTVTEGTFGMTVGDVCGKGAEAAALAALARHTIRTAAIIDPSPCQALHAVNLAVLRRVTEPTFITAAVLSGTITPTHAALQICIGGHPLPLLLDNHGSTREVGECGTLLGAYYQIELHSISVDLHPGESIILYTDGLTDTRSPEGVFGEDRAKATLRNLAGARASEIAKGLAQASQEFSDGNPQDDTAILVLQKPPLPLTVEPMPPTSQPTAN